MMTVRLPRYWLLLFCAAASLVVRPIGVDAISSKRHTHESRITLQGRASIVNWDCSTRDIQAEIEPPLDPDAVRAFFDRLNHVPERVDTNDLVRWTTVGAGHHELHVSIKVRGLDCGNRAMEKDLHKAVKSDRFPDIRYNFRRIAGLSFPGPKHEGKGIILHTEGDLFLAGEERQVIIDVHATLSDDYVDLHGSHIIEMSDFGITPPTALFGLIKAEQRVVIDYFICLPLSSLPPGNDPIILRP